MGEKNGGRFATRTPNPNSMHVRFRSIGFGFSFWHYKYTTLFCKSEHTGKKKAPYGALFFTAFGLFPNIINAEMNGV